jgi:uncharacterized phage-associated protein
MTILVARRDERLAFVHGSTEGGPIRDVHTLCSRCKQVGGDSEMARVDDVAAAILERQGSMSTWKLQKLVYYAQAWHLVWEERPLFEDRIEAWANGPVVRNLYERHRGWFSVESWPAGHSADLTPDESSTIDAVLETYGDKTAAWLSELTHQEPPWRDARVGLAHGERGNVEITQEAMAEYYGSLL